VEAAKSGVSQARSALLPSLAVQGGYTRTFMDLEQSTAVGSRPGGGPLVYQDMDTNYDNRLQGAVSAGINIDAANVGTFRQARKGLAMQREGYEAARRSIITSAKKLYIQAMLSRHVLEIREASEALSKELYESAQRKQKAGAIKDLDLLNSEVDWRSKSSAAVEARKNVEVVETALKNLAGIPLGEEVKLSQTWGSELPDLPDEEALGSVLAARPDYRALVLNRELANIEKQSACTAFLPTVKASYTYSAASMRDISIGTDPNNVQNSELTVTATIPLFTGGYRAAKVQAASINQEKALLSIAQKRDNVEADLAQIRMELRAAKSQMETAKLQQDTAERALKLSQTSYTSGLITRLDLAKAQDQFDQSRVGFENAVFQYLSAHFDWNLATGN
jgi:outer membrane protein TolC